MTIEPKHREFWVEIRKETVLPSNRLLYAYDKQQMELSVSHDVEMHTKQLIHVIEYSAFLAVKADLNTALKALNKIVEADRMGYGTDSYPIIAARAIEEIKGSEK